MSNRKSIAHRESNEIRSCTFLILALLYGQVFAGYGGMGSEWSESSVSAGMPIPNSFIFGFIGGGLYTIKLLNRNPPTSFYDLAITVFMGACIGSMVIGLPMTLGEILGFPTVASLVVLGFGAVRYFRGNHNRQNPPKSPLQESQTDIPPRRRHISIDSATRPPASVQVDPIPDNAIRAEGDPDNIHKYIVRCPSCSQKLRIPGFRRLLSVKCKRCNLEFLTTSSEEAQRGVDAEEQPGSVSPKSAVDNTITSTDPEAPQANSMSREEQDAKRLAEWVATERRHLEEREQKKQGGSQQP